jgi:hypothetical protein
VNSRRRLATRFPLPSFLDGVARLFVPSGVARRNPAVNGRRVDYLALRSDWEAVGDCLRRAIDEYGGVAEEDE